MTKLTSNKRGERPTLCKADSAISIGLSGCEVDSTRAELAIRTVIVLLLGLRLWEVSFTYSVTRDQPYSTKNRKHNVQCSCSCCGASTDALACTLY